MARIKLLKFLEPSYQKFVVQHDNTSLRKVRDSVTGHKKLLAHVHGSSDDIFLQYHEQKKWENNQNDVQKFFVSKVVRTGLRMA